MTRIACFKRSFQIISNSPFENWRSHQFAPAVKTISSIRGETQKRVANYLQSSTRLASGLKAAVLCKPTIYRQHPPTHAVSFPAPLPGSRTTYQYLDLRWSGCEETKI
jgi:hypothetical protein